MGQKSSKRQSYTPGGTQDAGLPTASVAENGDVRTGGANGQVQLISRKTEQGDVITSDVMTTSSVAATASSSTEKKKQRRAPRFVFSLKRTGSGKRSRKNRKEANGVRPTSYPPALSAEETTSAGPRATSDRERKAQSMFVEEVCEEVQEAVIPSTSNDGETEARKERKTSSASPRKASSESSSSASKPHKEKRRNGSQKQKSPSKKKQDKEAKKKSKKSKKDEADKAKKDEDDKQAGEEAAAAAAAATAVIEEVVIPEVETTQEQAASLQAPSAEASKGNDSEEPTTDDATKSETASKETPEEAAMGLSVAAFTEADVKLTFTENTAAAEEEEETLAEAEPPTLTAEELLAEIDQTILSKEMKEPPAEEEAQDTVQLKEADQAEEAEQKAEAQAAEQAPTQITQGEKVELVGHTIHEDILELINISSEVTDSTAQERSGQTGERGTEEGADQKTETMGNVSDVKEEVLESTITVEVQSSVEAVRPEPISDTVQQQVEQLVECTPSTETSIKFTEDGAEQETDTNRAKAPEQSGGTPQSIGQSPEPEQDMAKLEASGSSEPAADSASTPAEDAPPALTPAQLRAQEKERKAAKKKEEKERARKEKEEKKRLKEDKKREAKEQKRKEKEEKEQKLREAKEKARASANMTAIEVTAEEGAVEEAVTASHTLAVESTPPGAPASTDIQQLQREVEKTVVVEPQPNASSVEPQPTASTDSTQARVSVQLNEGADAAALSTLPPPPDSAKNTEDRSLGASVKEIISSIENNVAMEPKSYDENNPPDVPDAPYPEEEESVIQQSSAAVQFSAAPTSLDSSSCPASPEAEGAAESGAASPEPASASESSPFPSEVSESARSSVLRKIELGPRLRTAILRKSSSGAGESEEKRVSLTQPRHVQVSDLTPPPRKPRARRPLEHTRDSSGNYRYSGSFSPETSPAKEPEPVLEEMLTVEVVASNEASSSSPSTSGPSEQKAEEKKEETGDAEVETGGLGIQEVKEQLTVVVSSLSQSVQPPKSSPEEKLAVGSHEEEEEEQRDDDNPIQLNELVMGLISSPEGGPSTATTQTEPPESPAATEVAVASILLAGQTTTTADPAEKGGETSTGQAEAHQTAAVSAAEVQSQPDDLLLQKVAAEVVVQVQKAAQEKASALELEDKLAQLINSSSDAHQASNGNADHHDDDDDDSGARCQDSQAAALVQEEEKVEEEECGGGGGYNKSDDGEQDSDCEAGGLVQATVLCSAELVVVAPSSDKDLEKDSQSPQSCGAAGDSKGTGRSSELRGEKADDDTQGASEPRSHAALTEIENTYSAAVVVETNTPSVEPSKPEAIISSPSSAEVNSDPKVESHQQQADEEGGVESPREDRTGDQEDSAVPSQLQLFNKNYYDISVVVDNNNDDDDNNVEDDVSKTARAGEDNPEQKDNLTTNESPKEPSSSKTPSSSSQQQESPSESEQQQQQQQLPVQPTLQTGSSSSEEQLENGGGGHQQEEEPQQRQSEVKITVRCNGSHVLKQDDSIDALLKLRSGLNGEKETLEHNNNVSTEETTTAPERAESTATTNE